MNEIVQYQEPLTAIAIRAQVNLVQEVMKAVMKEGTHYGTIPGTPKPSLWKPGAEVLAATFRIAVSYKIEDLSTADVVRYRVVAIGTHQTSGIVMGEGMGECSSGEEKYKWRKAYDEEFAAAPEDKKRIKYGKYTAKQIRTEPADLANTILKMACKRAQVAMTLNVTAASDCFSQDLEDLSEELLDRETGEIHKKEPQPLPQAEFDKHKEKFKASVVSGKKTPEAVVAWANAQNLGFLTDAMVSEIKGWMPKPAENTDADPVKAAAIDESDLPWKD
jgi:protein-tyrosine-phosphatase